MQLASACVASLLAAPLVDVPIERVGSPPPLPLSGSEIDISKSRKDSTPWDEPVFG